MGSISDRILVRDVDYLLVLKANHSKAFLAVKECCERHCFARGATAKPMFDASDDSCQSASNNRFFQVLCDQLEVEAFSESSPERSLVSRRRGIAI